MMKRRYIGFLLVFLIVLVSGCANDTGASENDSFTVAVHNGVPGVFDEVVDSLIDHLAEQGYVEGENVTYIHTHSGEELTEAFTQKIDVVISIPATMAFLSDAPLDTVPVVFVPASDPVAQGLVESLSQPGGNVTGIMQQDATERRFRLLLDTVPDADLIYVVYDSTDSVSLMQVEAVQQLADTWGIEIKLGDSPLTDQAVTRQSIEQIPAEADAIFMVQGHGGGLGAGWTDAAVRHGIPLCAIGMQTLNSPYGPLMAYGPSMDALGEQTARMVGQVLKGTAPGDMPVEQAELYIMIDLRVADLIGLAVPDTMLRQAEVLYRAETNGDLPALAALEPEPTHDATSAGVCSALETNPIGTNRMCATVTCDLLLDSFVTYADRQDLETCPTEDLVGTCAMNEMDIHYYEGEAAMLKMGCGFSGGTWTDA